MAENRDVRGPGQPGGAATSDLARRIARARGDGAATADAAGARRGGGGMSGLARGLRIGTEFIAAILVGAAIGFGVDHLFGTRPWGLLTLLLMGFAAGILNVTRVVAQMNAENPAPPEADMGDAADDEDDER